MIKICHVSAEHAEAWSRMRCALWPDESESELRAEVSRFLSGGLENLIAVLIAIEEDRVLGFVELNIRRYAEGCTSNNVAFLEGWYVEPTARRTGVGRVLIEASEAWAIEQGCTEFASDTLADNTLGVAAHFGVGFEEVEVIRCFRKDLNEA